jgi:hypothetical protein
VDQCRSQDQNKDESLAHEGSPRGVTDDGETGEQREVLGEFT